MQNKGIVKFIAAALVLICIFYLSFSFVTAHYDNKANELGIEAGLKEGKNFINNMASKDDAAWLNANEAAVNTAIEKAFADGSRAGMNYVNENAALKEHSDLVASVIDRAVVAKEQAAQAYIESLSGKDANVWFGKSLKQCREMEMGLGLDLKGGMNVILEVSVPDIFDNLASNNKKDPQFREIMELAKQKEEQTPGGNFVNIFYDIWKEKAADRPLAAIFANDQMRDKVNTNSTNEQVIAAIDAEVQSAVDNAETVVRTRVDRFGVVQPNIQRLEGQSRIMIEMPGVKEPERVRKLLQGSANLEFWETYDAQDIYNSLYELSMAWAAAHSNTAEAAEEEQGEAAEAVEETAEAAEATAEAVADSAKEGENAMAARLGKTQEAAEAGEQSNAAALEALKAQNPLEYYLNGIRREGLSVVGATYRSDIATVNEIINSELAKKILPADVRLLWAAKESKYSDAKGDLFELHAIRVPAKGEPRLTGDVITSASNEFDQYNNAVVSMKMNTTGARIWANMTRENKGHAIAIVLDDMVYSAPRVNDEITGGSSQISGDFTLDETKDLANTLNSGKMTAPTRIVQEQVVGPTLGAQSIHQGIVSFIVAFILLMIVMVLLYNFIPGMLANMALLFNLFFTLGILASFQAALTMPGIAGIVLTLGTAVDANVLIYERTKEELRKGLVLKEALNKGYSNAFSAIFDSNLTSLITGIILFSVGTGPIKGFATTLIIGICVSFFTAVFMTRLVYDFQMKRDKWQHLTFTTPFSKNLMQNTHYNFMGKYKMSYTIWGCAAVLFCLSFLTRGLSRSIDFTGGRNYVIVLDKEAPVEDVRKALDGVFTDDEQPVSTTAIALGAASEKTIRISTNWKIYSNDQTIDDQAEEKIYEALNKAGLITEANLDEFKTPASGSEAITKGTIVSISKVGPSIAKSITRGAIISVILALIAIFLYILLRFRNVAFSVGSIVALAFDALIVVGFFSVLHSWVPMSLEIDQTFIGAILTVIGYSINDKVVVFDRIRENISLYGKRDRRQLFNDSLNQTLARTINTSVTTLIVLLTIFFLGGDSIRPFSFAMILGVIFGTLSSIFIAAPTAYLIIRRKVKGGELTPEGEKKPATK